MFRRRPRKGRPKELREALRAFGETIGVVEEAKARLVAAAPTGRSAGVPLAEALAGFESGLAEALDGMNAWRRPDVESAWSACRVALRRSADLAEDLRLRGSPQGYEELYTVLGDIMQPLDAFARAAEELHRRERPRR